MAEESPEALAARSVSAQWLNSLDVINVSYEKLKTQLEEDKPEWEICETKAILDYWLKIIADLRVQMELARTDCPEGLSKETLCSHINDNYLLEMFIKARMTAADNFVSVRRNRDGAGAAEPAPEGAVGVGRSMGSHLTRLALEPFDSEITKYDEWAANTKSLLIGITDDNIKVRRIKDSLTGQAKLYVCDIGSYLLTATSLWAHLDYRYKDKWAGNLEIANKFVTLIVNSLCTMGDLAEHLDKFRNTDLMAEQKGYSRECLATTLFLATLPDTLRSDIVKAVNIDHPGKSLFTWAELGKHAHRLIQEVVKAYEVNDLINLLIHRNLALTKKHELGSLRDLREIREEPRIKEPKSSSNNKAGDVGECSKLNGAYCALCGLQHRTRTCYKFSTIIARKKKVQETPNICYWCLSIHSKAHRSFTTPSICDRESAKCCGKNIHPKYLCPTLCLDN